MQAGDGCKRERRGEAWRGVERRGATSRLFFFSRGIGETPSGLTVLCASQPDEAQNIDSWTPWSLASPCLHKFKVTSIAWASFCQSAARQQRAPSRTLAHPRAVCGPLFALVARFPSHTHPSNSNFPRLMQPSTSRDTGFPACN